MQQNNYPQYNQPIINQYGQIIPQTPLGQPYVNPAMINQYQYNQQNQYGQPPMNQQYEQPPMNQQYEQPPMNQQYGQLSMNQQYGQPPMNQNQYGQQGQLPLMNQPLSGSQIIYQQQMITPGEDKNQQMSRSQNNIQNN